jgi:hypothetical protein
MLSCEYEKTIRKRLKTENPLSCEDEKKTKRPLYVVHGETQEKNRDHRIDYSKLSASSSAASSEFASVHMVNCRAPCMKDGGKKERRNEGRKEGRKGVREDGREEGREGGRV